MKLLIVFTCKREGKSFSMRKEVNNEFSEITQGGGEWSAHKTVIKFRFVPKYLICLCKDFVLFL